MVSAKNCSLFHSRNNGQFSLNSWLLWHFYIWFSEISTLKGQYLSLMFYGFFIFYPMQEIEYHISYREAGEASLKTLIIWCNPEEKPWPKTNWFNRRVGIQARFFQTSTAYNIKLWNISFDVKTEKPLHLLHSSGSGKVYWLNYCWIVSDLRREYFYNQINGTIIWILMNYEIKSICNSGHTAFAGTIKENLFRESKRYWRRHRTRFYKKSST